MNELITNPKTHVIITWNKTHHFITENQYSQVCRLGLNDRIQLDGNTIFGKSIAEIVSVSKYYETYPDKKPVAEVKAFVSQTINQTLGSFSPTRRKKALESMRAGFLGHFQGSDMPSNAKSMLKEMEMRIGTAEWNKS